MCKAMEPSLSALLRVVSALTAFPTGDDQEVRVNEITAEETVRNR